MRSVGLEHSPEDLATVLGGQNPERVREAGHDGEPSPMQIRTWVPLARYGGTMVPDGEPQGSQVPDDRQVDLGAGIDC